MALKDIRKLLIDCLRRGHYQHEPREALAEKNLLAIGDVNADFVIGLLRACSERNYQLVTHDVVPRIKVHIFTPEVDGERWYIKAYMISTSATFISVHKSKPQQTKTQHGEDNASLERGR